VVTDDALKALNEEIGRREQDGDGRWFDRLLAPEFAMRRASGVHVNRATFLSGVKASEERATSEVDVLARTDQNAMVVCVVAMTLADGSVKRFRNHRLFARPDAAAEWQLLGWANETT
jgi:hypothetical protein